MSRLPTEKIVLKLFARPEGLPPKHAFVEVFHQWIKTHALEETLVDVADYGHVHHGPSVLLTGHESDYVIDEAEGRVGLLYRRKRARAAATAGEGRDGVHDEGRANARANALDDALARLLRAAKKLEDDPRLRGLSFSRDELSVSFTDRLGAPNDEATYEAVAPLVKASVDAALGTTSVRRDVRDARAPLTLVASRTS